MREEEGRCRAVYSSPTHVRVASATLHFGEEPPLVGDGGSGTVFFTHCNLRCVFCQNHEISQGGVGEEVDARELAKTFLALMEKGAVNINLVTPTHAIYPTLIALRDAYQKGLSLPLVYNTNAFDSVPLLRALDGIVDIYLPDMKYMRGEHAKTYSRAEAYPAVMQEALREMWRQVGALRFAGDVATSGLLIRHLVLPNDVSDSYDALILLSDAKMTGATLNIMSQYSPCYEARTYPDIAEAPTVKEYKAVVAYAIEKGFEHVIVQGIESRDVYLPDFSQDDPFASSR